MYSTIQSNRFINFELRRRKRKFSIIEQIAKHDKGHKMINKKRLFAI